MKWSVPTEKNKIGKYVRGDTEKTVKNDCHLNKSTFMMNFDVNLQPLQLGICQMDLKTTKWVILSLMVLKLVQEEMVI
jgi:hypothetical protein